MNSMAKPKLAGPIAVGGVGGSGTRVVAEILSQLGFYIGSDLNYAKDNLGFTLLFKRPRWFIRKSQVRKSDIFKGLSIFEKAMAGCLTPEISELNFIMRAAFEMAIAGHDHLHSGRGLWSIKRAINLLRLKNIDISGFIGWGWKEPNTHIYIEYLSEYFHNLKYIHVIRHGLDMAFSSNQAQLFNWGEIFGTMPNHSVPLPKVSLQYWIKANERAVSLGNKLLNKRFLMINFDRLCLAPEQEIALLIDFLGLDNRNPNMDQLISLPKIPRSTGRYLRCDRSIFSKEEIKAVQELGFAVG